MCFQGLTEDQSIPTLAVAVQCPFREAVVSSCDDVRGNGDGPVGGVLWQVFSLIGRSECTAGRKVRAKGVDISHAWRSRQFPSSIWPVSIFLLADTSSGTRGADV